LDWNGEEQAMKRKLAVALLTASSCTASWYHDDADREVDEIVREFDAQALGHRADHLKMPEPEKQAAEPAPAEEGAAPAVAPATAPAAVPDAPPLLLDLRTTLQIAVTSSRDYLTSKESLYLQGLGFSLTRFNYGPQWSSAVNYVWGDGDGTTDTSGFGGSVGVSQLLPTNGTVSLEAGMARFMNRDDLGRVDDWSTTSGISFTQPLLRGAGYDLYRESLTQAERNMVEAIRRFELFRQDYIISIADQFYGLVSQKRKLVNVELDLETANFDANRAEALYLVGREKNEGVIQAKRRRLEAESTATDSRVAYQRAVESFLIQLGLDPKTKVDFADDEPPFEPVSFDKESAIAAAMENRLDVQSQRAAIEDAERNFKLARNNLLPDLNVNANYGSSGVGHGGPADALPNTWNRSASVSLEIPLQTMDRRNAWRQAEIAIDQTRRGWQEFVDSVMSSVEDQLRQLKNTERQLEIAKESLQDEEDAAFQLQIDLEKGTVGSRELIEARRKKITVQNNLVDFNVDHFIQRLRLYRNLGILFIDEKGYWSVGRPPAAKGDGR
jgi:outer membrane protein TolC